MKFSIYWLSTFDVYVCTSLVDCNYRGQSIGSFANAMENRLNGIENSGRFVF